MLQKIKKSKYPAITAEEEAVSIPLQTLCQAIFDAILVHIVNTVSAGGKWQQLQQQMCDALNRRKDEHTIGILSRTYYDADVLFIQEAASMFMATAGKTALGAQYHIAASSSLDGKRDHLAFVAYGNADGFCVAILRIEQCLAAAEEKGVGSFEPQGPGQGRLEANAALVQPV